ncbi:hypothetical protein NKI34_23235 [Mesorhizobium sp. M0700]|uniref:hypothetical protein n=1 Tax=Mesorhizobium sp. M0700 TaxID=2956988 RepID=UPI00333E16C3
MLEVPRDEEAFAIVDRIYEAAFAAELWPNALEATSAISRSAGGAIFMINDHLPLRAIGNAHLQPLLDEFMAGDNWNLSEGVQRTCSTQPAGFVRIDDLMTGEEIERDPVDARARRFGVTSPVFTSISMPSGELVLLAFPRWLKDEKHDQAAIELLNGLRPHFARAGLVAGRLGLERAKTAVSILSEIGLSAAVMSGSGRVLTANPFWKTWLTCSLPWPMGAWHLRMDRQTRFSNRPLRTTRTTASCGPSRFRPGRGGRP